jgi:hypothetical protein
MWLWSPVRKTEILGQGLTLAQMDSLCGNVVVSALSRGACSTVHTQVYGGWIIAVILIISGLVEAIFGKKNAIIEMLKNKGTPTFSLILLCHPGYRVYRTRLQKLCASFDRI